MKKLIYSASLMMLLSVSTLAKADGVKTGEGKTTLTYLNIGDELEGAENVIWVKSPKYLRATFVKNGAPMSAFYNWQKELIATTQHVEITKLSATAIKNIIKEFGGYKMGEIIEYKNGETLYFINLMSETKDFIIKVDADNEVSVFKNLKK